MQLGLTRRIHETEGRLGTQLNRDVEVAGRAAVQTRTTEAAQPQALAVAQTLRNLQLDRAFLHLPTALAVEARQVQMQAPAGAAVAVRQGDLGHGMQVFAAHARRSAGRLPAGLATRLA